MSRLPVVGGLAVLDAVDILALLHVAAALDLGRAVHHAVAVLELYPLPRGGEQRGRAGQLVVLAMGVIEGLHDTSRRSQSTQAI